MKNIRFLKTLVYFTLVVAALAAVPASAKEVIAHRGASGYLPEHTLEAYAYGYAQGADWIEPDLMLTKCGALIALHDRSLDATTDVAERFPGRARDDGLHYAVDFTLEEIRQLRVRERVDSDTGEHTFPSRWPNKHQAIHFRVPTLAEIIELVQGLNHVTGRNVGVYPETKASNWHLEQGFDFEAKLLEELGRYGYSGSSCAVIIQSFEPESLLRLRELGTEIRLVQLIGGGRRYHDMVTAEGLDAVAKFADGIGPSMTRIVNSSTGELVDNNFLVREAHARGLIVHPYTMRSDVLPEYAASFAEMAEKLLFEAGADGAFTDQPGQMVEFLKKRNSCEN